MTSVRTLLIEDSADDADLLLMHLRSEGWTLDAHRVDREDDLRQALNRTWDVVISDYSLPGFSAEEAVQIVSDFDPDLPLIVVSGTIGEALAVEVMRRGARDYIMKGDLRRLGPAIEREVKEAQVRREKRFAEEALRESEQRFRSAFEQSVVGIVHVTADGRILRVNPKFCELLGFKAEELIARSFEEFTHPEDVAPSLEMLERVEAAADGTHTLEKRYIRKDGTEVWTEVTISPVRNSQGRIVYLSSAIQDITERKQADQALRESLQFNRAVLASLAAHVAVLERNGRIVSVNESWIRFAEANGQDPDRVGSGADYLAVTRTAARDDDDARRALEGIEQVLEGRTESFWMTYPCHSPDQKRWFLLSVKPLSSESGGAVVSHLDISQRKLAEERLAESEARYRSLFERNLAAVYLTSEDGGVIDCNEACVQMFGFSSREELMRHNAAEFYVNPSDRSQLIGKLRREGSAVNMEMRLRRADGREIRVLENIALLDEPGSAVLQKTIIDITEWRESESERLRLASELSLMLDSTMEGFCAIDLEGRCTLVNRAGAEMLGYTPDELAGVRMHELVHSRRPDGSPYPWQECAIHRALVNGTPSRVRDEEFHTGRGTSFPVEYSCSPLVLDGEVIGGVVTFSDISQQLPDRAATGKGEPAEQPRPRGRDHRS